MSTIAQSTSPSRRELLALTASLSVVSHVFAGMPIPQPATLEEQLTYWGNYLCIGVPRQIRFLSKATGELFLREGPAVKFRDLEFLDKPSGGPAVLEVLQTKIIMIRPDAGAKEFFPGRTYSFIRIGFPEIKERFRDVAGTEQIMVFKDRLVNIGQRRLADDGVFLSTGGRTALDRFPFPISDLPTAISIAQKLGFVKPR